MGLRYFKHWVKHGSTPGIIAFALMLISNFCAAKAQATPKGGIDWIVVVDTSASMRGVGGTKDIFDQVKNSVTEFVNTAQLGDTVTIYTFDRDVTLLQVVIDSEVQADLSLKAGLVSIARDTKLFVNLHLPPPVNNRVTHQRAQPRMFYQL
ncbi:MAG: VWA domain-containing protein [Calothrix sp. C42_A2020_038]|nr:VWA domain-containing protein [Calothrix sp. C42_A2020_038]